MKSKVDIDLHLAGDGKSVAVTGPILKWDTGETAAVFTVVISQVSGNGAGIVNALGWSTVTYQHGVGTWSATARVNGANGRLHPGEATAAAYATIAGNDGVSGWYPWTLPVRLLTP
jgi:hypothetical protein